jgi:phosphoribosylformimino-5-aminoimidazole carboxamide ribotide isomerase
MRFRPCIDLHDGQVKQIVGGSLDDGDKNALETNFASDRPPAWFAERYRKDHLTGGHIIQLGPGNRAAAASALAAWPQGMQIGGGVNVDNAVSWIEAGAAAVIVTSWVFHDGRIDMARLSRLVDRIGPDRLVLDLSARKRGDDYVVVTDRWQAFTEEVVTLELLDRLADFCCEFLIHAVDVEGRCRGIERPLVERLGQWQGLPVTYAGGIHTMEDILTIDTLGRGNIDFTVGSALDIFGGTGLSYDDLAQRFS